MAISGSAVFDVRPTGSDSNGGAFVTGATGADYSQQDSAQYALTGVTSSGSGNTVLSASAASDMVGNIANVVSGTNMNTGRFEVTSVVAGVSITFSTNNSGASICTGAASSGVINIGGALATIGAAISAAKISGQIIYCKDGGSDIALTGSALAPSPYSNPISVIGFTTTHGDGGQCSFSGSGMTSGQSMWTVGDHVFLANITAKNARFRSFNGSGQSVCVNCYSYTDGDQGFFGLDTVYGCYSDRSVYDCDKIYGCVAPTIRATQAAIACVATTAMNITGSDGTFFNSTCLGNIDISAQPRFCSGLISYGSSGYALSRSRAPVRNFAWGNATSGRWSYSGKTDLDSNIIQLTADPFTNRTGIGSATTVADKMACLSLNNTAGGGALLRAAGFPAYLDIGAIQHQDAGYPTHVRRGGTIMKM